MKHGKYILKHRKDYVGYFVGQLNGIQPQKQLIKFLGLLSNQINFLRSISCPGMDPAPFLIPALEPFSGRDSEDRLLCPVRMVKKYLKFTGGPKPKERLFRKIRGEGHPSTQTVSTWIKACVRFVHQHRPDVHVSAHEVRRMSASWAFHGGAHSVQDILEAGTWANHSTFTSYYLADVRLQMDGRFRLQPVVARKQVLKF